MFTTTMFTKQLICWKFSLTITTFGWIGVLTTFMPVYIIFPLRGISAFRAFIYVTLHFEYQWPTDNWQLWPTVLCDLEKNMCEFWLVYFSCRKVTVMVYTIVYYFLACHCVCVIHVQQHIILELKLVFLL